MTGKAKSSASKRSSDEGKKSRFTGLSGSLLARKKGAKSSSPRPKYANKSDQMSKVRAVENDPKATPLEVLHVSKSLE